MDYPKMLYRQGNPRDFVVVNDENEEAALPEGFTDTPVALNEGEQFVPPKATRTKA
jgi:hypothetical protein